MKINKRTKFTRAISLLLAITMVSSMISFDFFDVLADINSTPANLTNDNFYLKLTGGNTQNITIEAWETKTENNTSSDTTSSEQQPPETDSPKPVEVQVVDANDGIAIFKNLRNGIEDTEYTFTCTIEGVGKKEVDITVKKDGKPVMMEWNPNLWDQTQAVTEYFQVTLLQDEKGTLEFESKENIVEKDKVSFVKDGNSVKVIATANANSDYMVKNILVKNIFGNKKSQAYQNILIEEDTEISAEYDYITKITIESKKTSNDTLLRSNDLLEHNNDVNVTITVIDEDFGGSEQFDPEQVKLFNQENSEPYQLNAGNWNPTENGKKYTATLKIEAEGTYKFTAKYGNNGKICSDPKPFLIDKTDPTLKVSVVDIDGKTSIEKDQEIFNKAVKATITVTDIDLKEGKDKFNKDNIQIKKDGKIETPSLIPEGEVDKTHKYSFDLTEEGTYTISYNDKAGNSSVDEADKPGERTIIIDKSIPRIEIDFDENGTISDDGTINFAEASINATVTVEFGKEMKLDPKKLAEIVEIKSTKKLFPINCEIKKDWVYTEENNIYKYTKEISIKSDTTAANGVFDGYISAKYDKEQTLIKNFKLNITLAKPTIKYYKIDTKTGGFGEEIEGNLIAKTNTRYFNEPVMYRVLVMNTALDTMIPSTINISPKGSLSLDE
ncbi:MAG: hypothetical protein RSA79_03040, partial [Oscillospiraceae bacterium]